MKTKDYAPIIARLALSIVLLWFGINQLLNPVDFMGYLPEVLLNSQYPGLFIVLNGIFDAGFGLLLAIGLLTKISAFAVFLHLVSIAISLGYNDIAVRDFGLALVAFSIFLRGADKWTLDYKRQSS